jgi:hypothetical protein
MYQVSPVCIGLQVGVELLYTGIQGLAQVILVHIADRHQTATLVTSEMEAAHANAADTDDAPRELVTGRHEIVVSTHLSEHFPGKDGEKANSGSRFLDKTSSRMSHSVIL